MDNKFDGLSTDLTSASKTIDWEVYYNDKNVAGQYHEHYDYTGDYDWNIKIYNEDKLTDDEIDEIYDYIKQNINT
jgi:hypothetical protein